MQDIFTEWFANLLMSGTAIIVPVVELIKRLFHLTGIASVIVALIVSIAVGFPYGLSNNLHDFVLVVYVATLFAIANGWYKVIHRK